MEELKSEIRTLQVQRMYKDGSVIKKEEIGEDFIDVIVPPKDVPLAEVGISSSMTLNLGNYESVKLGISITLPCVLGEVEEAFKAAKKFIDMKLNSEVEEIREYRRKRSTE